MIDNNKLNHFAELAIKVGVNLQKDQFLVVNCPVECAYIARIIVEQAYKAGAGQVFVNWRDDVLSRLNMQYASEDVLKDIPQWQIDKNDYYIKKGVALISVAASDPAVFAGLDAAKIRRVSTASAQAQKNFHNATMSNVLRWCVVSVPTSKWAQKVFPDCNESEAVDKLWKAIATIMRLDKDDPTKAWQDHCDNLSDRAEFLNNNAFKAIHLKNAKGTDVTIGLPDNHVWLAAKEKAQDGVEFLANIPTEEVFTAPHRLTANGRVVNALPLCENGEIIDDFFIEFKDGRIVDFGAKQGYETLKGLIETDEGTHYLGEIALVSKQSPIAKQNRLFFNTLFDENASCHLAIGKGYPSCVKDYLQLDEKQLFERGVNNSVEHVDFMIGTPDMFVEGIKKDGTRVTIFENGDWVK